MAPKFTVKLKANVPVVEYTAAQRAFDWHLATGMLRQLMLHALDQHLTLLQHQHVRHAQAATTPLPDGIGTTETGPMIAPLPMPTHDRMASTAACGATVPGPTETIAESDAKTTPAALTLQIPLVDGDSPWHCNEEAAGEGPAQQQRLADSTTFLGHRGAELRAAMDVALSFSEEHPQQQPPPPPLTADEAVPMQPMRMHSCEAVASSVKNLVRHGDAKRLYEDGLRRVLSQYVPAAMDWLRGRMAWEPTMAIRFVTFLWGAYTLSLQHMAAVFADLGQGFIIQHTAERSIHGIGVRLFCDALKRYDDGALQRQFHLGFLALVEADRRGFVVDRRVLEAARSISLEAQLYFSELEPLLVQRTTAFYTALVEELLYVDCVEGDVFFRAVHKRLNDEKERIVSCCDRKSKALLEEAAQKALLVVHGPEVLASSFAAMTESEETYPAIRLAWKLLSLRYVAKGDAARVSFRDFIVSQGGMIVNRPPSVAAAAPAAPASGATRPTPPSEDATITDLIALYTKGQAIVKTAFDGMEAFALTLREALQAAIRPKEGRTAEALAKYLDSYLRDGVRKETDDDVEKAIDLSMRLFSLIPAKDVFEAFYAELLAKRLVFQRTRSLELERLVVRKVKDVVGSSSSMKLEGMLKDLAINEELNQTYLAAVGAYLVSHEHIQNEASAQSKDAEEEGGASMAPESPCSPASPSTESKSFARAFSPLAHAMQRVDSKFLVLTVGYWPTTFPKLRIFLPKHLQLLSDHFAQFYVGRHGGRRLDWTPTLSTCSVRAHFDKGKKDIAMNLLQGVILTFFNDPGVMSLTYGDICHRINPSDEGGDGSNAKQENAGGGGASSSSAPTRLHAGHPDLICALLSISGAPSQRLLLRGSGTASATIDPKETFSVNAAFVHRQVKFRVNQVQLRDPQQDAQIIKEKALSERSHVVDAAIVRYMKSRKRASHNDLANDVIAMLKFPASTGDVKKRIEIMIEREYLRRDAKDASVYEYVA